MLFNKRFWVEGVTAFFVAFGAVGARNFISKRTRLCATTHFYQFFIGPQHAAANTDGSEPRAVCAASSFNIREKHEVYKMLRDAAVLM